MVFMKSKGQFASALPLVGVVSTLVLLSPFGTRVAQAQVTSHTSLASFLAATQSISQTFTFEGIAPLNNVATNPNLSPLTVSVTGGSNLDYFVVDSGLGGGSASLNGTDSLAAGIATDSLPTVTIAFGSAVTAFGTEVGFRSSTGGPIPSSSFTATLFNGATQVGTAFNSGTFQTGFVGFTSPLATFDRIRIQTTGSLNDAVQIYDNLQLGTAAPEPGSLAILMFGVPVLFPVLRRRTR